MCLGIPGKVIRIDHADHGMAMGIVSFGGVNKEVCLAYVPDVRIDDYVIVHVGFAIGIISEEDAEEVFRLLRQIEERSDTPTPE